MSLLKFHLKANFTKIFKNQMLRLYLKAGPNRYSKNEYNMPKALDRTMCQQLVRLKPIKLPKGLHRWTEDLRDQRENLKNWRFKMTMKMNNKNKNNNLNHSHNLNNKNNKIKMMMNWKLLSLKMINMNRLMSKDTKWA